MRKRMDRTKEFLSGLADLPVPQARRIVAAIAAKESPAVPSVDDLLDQAAAAMQAAMEAAMVPIIQAAASDIP